MNVNMVSQAMQHILNKRQGEKYPNQIYENIVDVSLLSGIKLLVPFTEYAFPDGVLNESGKKN